MCVCTHTLRIDTLSRFKIYLWTNDDNPLMGSVEGRREGGGARARADGRLKRWLRLRGKGPWLEEGCILFGINEPYSILFREPVSLTVTRPWLDLQL